jgi:hypothetical protein
MSDSCDTITADGVEVAGFSVDWASQLPVATYHTDDGEHHCLRDDLAPWLGGPKHDDRHC